MRYLDYWVGIPVCFIFSCINCVSRFTNFIKRRKKETAPKKILFIKLSEIGSIILSYSLLKRARQDYPSAEIFFLTFKRNSPVFEILDEILPSRNILTIREDSIMFFMLDTFKIVRRLWRERIDIVFDLELFSRFTAIISYLSKSSKRVGFYHYSREGLYRGNFLTHRVRYNPFLHISKTYFSLWPVIEKEMKLTPELKERIDEESIILPKFSSSAEVKEQAWKRLEQYGIKKENRLFLVAPGEGNLPLREWPLDYFFALSEKILKDKRNYIIIIGGKSASSFKKAGLLSNRLQSKKCIDLAGKTNLSGLMALFDIAHFLIANDCGLAHLSSLASIKKFIIFGPETPLIYGPLGGESWIIYSGLACSPCFSAFNHRRSSCRDNRCLKVVVPEDVYSLIEQQL